MKNILLLVILLFSFILNNCYITQARSTRTSSSDVYVKWYYKKDWTYVSPYYRSAPDWIKSNNYSCIDYWQDCWYSVTDNKSNVDWINQQITYYENEINSLEEEKKSKEIEYKQEIENFKVNNDVEQQRSAWAFNKSWLGSSSSSTEVWQQLENNLQYWVKKLEADLNSILLVYDNQISSYRNEISNLKSKINELNQLEYNQKIQDEKSITNDLKVKETETKINYDEVLYNKQKVERDKKDLERFNQLFNEWVKYSNNSEHQKAIEYFNYSLSYTEDNTNIEKVKNIIKDLELKEKSSTGWINKNQEIDVKLSSKAEAIFQNLKNKYKNSTSWEIVENYKKIIKYLKKYRDTKNNENLTLILNEVIKKLELEIAIYEVSSPY